MASRVQIPLAVETFDKTTGFVLPVNKATITITDRTTSTPATVYAAEEGGATITPTTDEHGQVTGWVEEGAYVVVASGGTAPVTIAPTTYDFDGTTGRVAVAGGRGLVEKDIEALFGKSIEFLKQAICPSGTILSFGGAGAPAGWLLCDGSSYLRATYPTLFSAIGTIYGAADGSHFNVPDARSRTLIGAGSGPGLTTRNLGDKLGEEKHTLVNSELSSHTHEMPVINVYGTVNTSSFGALSGSISGAMPDHVHHSPFDRGYWISTRGLGSSYKGQIAFNEEIGGMYLETYTGGVLGGGGIGFGGSCSVGGTMATYWTDFPNGTSSLRTAGGTTAANASGGQAHNNMQPSLAVNSIIKI